ncbi:hypothetical protein [Enterococcus sp. AZ109]|uniref:hypothetical protein n=1 Tax=Enterococcus sp. AZ109 TaxID=2774634 RepID=UPI003F23854C
MKTTKKWLIFWGILAALFVAVFAVVLTGNFPQFTIPFSVFASDEKEQQETELPKLPALALKDVNDQELLSAQTDKINALNDGLQQPDSLASSQDLEHVFLTVFGNIADDGIVYELYRKVYPMISSEEAAFVQVGLIGFGQTLQDEQAVTNQRQQWTFTMADGTRRDYLVDITYNDSELMSLTVSDGADTSALLITADDTYLDRSADFETQWADMIASGSDEQLYQQMRKSDLSPEQTEFAALEKEVPLKDPTGFFDLFVATRGDLRQAYLNRFYHSNSPIDGVTDYYFLVPTSQTESDTYKVEYDRLQQRINSVTKQ